MATMGNNPSSEPDMTTVFTSNEKEERVYRIPAVFYDTDEKILLAFAEKRKTKDDAHSLAMVMKRGRVTKDGTTSQVTFEEPEITLVDKADHGHRPMNPCPLYEKSSKTLFLFFILVEGTISEHRQIKNYDNKARLCYMKTTDAGKSWSELIDLTEMSEMKNFATFAVGPGHGLQTQDGTLIVPVNGYCCCSLWCYDKCCRPTQYALCLYSTDQGDTWKFGQKLHTNSGECLMAEFFDDADKSVVYCNARVAGGYRVEALSEDSGNEFKPLDCAEKLVETSTGCQGSVVSFPAQDEGQDQKPKWLLYSHPSDQSRKDLAVYLNKSPHDSTKWRKPWIIHHGPSAYSDLVYISDGWFACLMECGKKSPYEQIAVKVFSYSNIENHVKE